MPTLLLLLLLLVIGVRSEHIGFGSHRSPANVRKNKVVKSAICSNVVTVGTPGPPGAARRPGDRRPGRDLGDRTLRLESAGRSRGRTVVLPYGTAVAARASEAPGPDSDSGGRSARPGRRPGPSSLQAAPSLSGQAGTPGPGPGGPAGRAPGKLPAAEFPDGSTVSRVAAA
eukprot:768815-Hanusia_phi.AAC.6